MTILLTGATGFLGTFLLEELKDQQLRILTRSPHKLKESSFDVRQVDISKPLDLDLMEGIDTIIHSAAKVGGYPVDPMAGYYQTNVEGTRQLLEAAISHGVSRVIYTSSYFALGPTGPEVVDTHWCKPPAFDHPYVSTKFQAGKLVDEMSDQLGVMQLLPTVIIGPGIDNPVADVILDYINGKLIGLPGGGQSWMNFVRVQDVARAHRLALDHFQPGKFLIAGQNMQLIQLLDRIGSKLKIGRPRTVPFWAAKIYARILELGGDPSMTRGDVEVTRYNWRYHNDMDKLGLEPTDLDKTIDELLQFFYEKDKLSKSGKRRLESYFNNK